MCMESNAVKLLKKYYSVFIQFETTEIDDYNDRSFSFIFQIASCSTEFCQVFVFCLNFS